MEFRKVTLENCAEEAKGIVIVIDVIRAFTTAAFAFAAGAETITLVGTVEEALGIRQQNPHFLVMGEVEGLPPQGFDFGNSPTVIAKMDLRERHLIQRTSAGTQGVIKSPLADVLLTGSFCCARATVAYVQQLNPSLVTFVITGDGPDGRGEEDWACAEYLEELFLGRQPDSREYIRRVKECRNSRVIFADPRNVEFLWQDIEHCTEIDRFDFAMVVARQNGWSVMRPYRN